jgi:hypothetical protein
MGERVRWSDDADDVIRGDLTAAAAYLTPAGGAVVTAVAPCGIGQRDTGADRPLRQPGIADQYGHRRERAGTVRPGVVGQAHEHERARARRLPAAIGRDRGQVQRPGDRLDAHGASVLTSAAP